MGNENGNKNFGDTLLKLMQQRNISARELAKGIEEPQKTVNDWLTHKKRIPRDPQTIKKLAEYFGVGVYFILFGQEDPKNILDAILEKTEIHTGLYEISIKKVKPKVGGE